MITGYEKKSDDGKHTLYVIIEGDMTITYWRCHDGGRLH